MVKKVFSERLKQAREKKGLSLKALRDSVGVSQSAMSHYANGTTLPTLDIAMKIAQELEVSVDWLCGNEDENGGVNTLGDVARSILDIWESSIAACLETEKDVVRFQIISKELSEFCGNAVELRKILCGEKRSVYDIWEKSELQALDKIPFPQIKDIGDEDTPV